ncbi:DUF1295-domain-containing protein [Xylariomycetidae sp. FL0641]|nr:DUF1295-domain-containing protein [Xylariomycetidae sp. FL0641]KAI0026157.1 DUF1295-domain-containing protein [Xylariomycetidae sp. FL0641]
MSGAEQDRLGGWFGGNRVDKAEEKVRQNMPQGSGAEQDRYGGWFGGDAVDQAEEAVKRRFPQGSGAEQDRYSHWFGGDKLPSRFDLEKYVPKTSGAEQDRYGRWFGGDKLPSRDQVQRNLPNAPGSEQARYGHWFGGDKIDQAGEKIRQHMPGVPSGSGAEQDRLGSWFGGDKLPSGDDIASRMPSGTGAEQDRYGSHFSPFGSDYAKSATTTSTLGLLQHQVLPSFGFHSGLGVIAYGIGRYTDTAEAKDWLWPTGQVANAWWSAIGVPVLYGGLSVSDAWARLSYNQKLLLTGVSAWGVRLLYRIASRRMRRGTDDPRYHAVKKEPGFWNKAFFTMFLPEAAVQTLISLPFTLPFRAPFSTASASPLGGFYELSHGLAVFLFTAGYALETFADSQLESHTQANKSDLNRDGVWSVVRHPNYLGDALVHLSFPFLLYSAGQMHPLTVLGPLANYAFLRYVGGDKQNEEYQESRYSKENPVKHQQLQEYKREKNSFWPSVKEASNKWVWVVAAVGAGGVAVEQLVRRI